MTDTSVVRTALHSWFRYLRDVDESLADEAQDALVALSFLERTLEEQGEKLDELQAWGQEQRGHRIRLAVEATFMQKRIDLLEEVAKAARVVLDWEDHHPRYHWSHWVEWKLVTKQWSSLRSAFARLSEFNERNHDGS